MNSLYKKFNGYTIGIILMVVVSMLTGCNQHSSDKTTISNDPSAIASGKKIFLQQCSSCHNFRQDGIGPKLSGITAEVTPAWIGNFIKNPQAALESGDEQAKKLFAKYKTPMPPFPAFSDEDINDIIAYLNTQKSGGGETATVTGDSIGNPMPEKIPSSVMTIALRQVAQFPATSKNRPYARITKMAMMPNTGRMFIVDLRGKLYELKNNKPEVYLDIAKLEPHFIDEPGLATGFGSFAFDPEFSKNGLLYTTHTEAPGSGKADFGYADSIPVTVQWVVTEWKTKHPEKFPFEGKGRELFRINMVTGIHGVQEITFNPDAKPGDDDYRLLYIGIGDGGSTESGFPFLCHNIEKPWGTILRIDPNGHNSANGHYGIPADNPFVNNSDKNALGEIFAYGFRNPHRFTWTQSGMMLAVNIGQSNIESINLIKPGHDYGWNIREGNFMMDPYGDINKIYPLPADDSLYHVTYPVAMYDHDEGNAITGGYEYTGSAIPELKGKFLFGDIPSGRLFYINIADIHQGSLAPIRSWEISLNGKPETLADLCGSKRVDLRLGRDNEGEMYLMTKADGKIYKLIGSGQIL